MERPPSLRFAEAARLLALVARPLDLAVPAFRSPPRLAGFDRTIRRLRGADRTPSGAVVSVRMVGRPFDDVVHDMIEGLIVANRLTGSRAADARQQLAAAVFTCRPVVSGDVVGAAPSVSPGSSFRAA